MEPTLHHVGHVLTAPLATVIEHWRESVGAIAVSELIHDPVQRVRAVFLKLPAGPDIELLEAAAEDSPIRAFAAQGGGLHHLCFEVDDLEAHLADMRKRKAMLVRKPQDAIAFSGRQIAWMLTRERLLLEFLQRAR
jgi:methylmalonyl-CoA/ethylmalonyl-CoA epimerase